jgi:hypothetical protein
MDTYVRSPQPDDIPISAMAAPRFVRSQPESNLAEMSDLLNIWSSECP